MGISSYTNYECSFPKGSVPQERLEEWANDPYMWVNRMVVDGDEVTIHFDGETGYSSYVLDDLVGLFDRPLDEVLGLRMDLHYATCTSRTVDARTRSRRSYTGSTRWTSARSG